MRKIKAIVAMDRNNAIGKDNKMMWHIKDDFKHFKEVTKNSMVIMGRKTYESIGSSLPNRVNVVLTSNKGFEPYLDKDIIVHSYEELENVINGYEGENVFCIGGGQLYEKYLDIFTEMYVTIVREVIEEPDTFFPKNSWNVGYDISKPRIPYTDDNGVFICEYFKMVKKSINFSDEFIEKLLEGWNGEHTIEKVVDYLGVKIPLFIGSEVYEIGGDGLAKISIELNKSFRPYSGDTDFVIRNDGETETSVSGTLNEKIYLEESTYVFMKKSGNVGEYAFEDIENAKSEISILLRNAFVEYKRLKIEE